MKRASPRRRAVWAVLVVVALAILFFALGLNLSGVFEFTSLVPTSAAGWTAKEIDLAELNEAFASQSLACIRDLDLDPAKVNVNGGAIALGHPLGSSGSRLVTTLVHEMNRRGAKHGLATMCIGVGQGIAVTLER